MKENKMYYNAPEVEVVEMTVEQGFATSNTPGGDGGITGGGEGGYMNANE